MEHKQGQHEHFSDYVSDTHNLQFKLKHKIAEDDFVDLLKDNMNSQMGGLLLTLTIGDRIARPATINWHTNV